MRLTSVVPRVLRAALLLAALSSALPRGLEAAPGAAAEAPAASASPVGLWRTFDDRTGRARAIVRIYEQDGRLFGKIVQSFTPGAESRVCTACKDDRKDRPILGLLIIRDMTRTDDGYAGGDILDPESGSVYRCKFHLEDHGTRLVVRGFIGISLLGRTQVWERQGAS